jgi:hypothetical protein
MAAIKNKRDKFLQDPANAPRLNVVSSNYIQLVSPTLIFRKTAAGVTPSTIAIVATGMGRLQGLPVTFSTVSGTGNVSVVGNTATVSNVTTNNIIIKASITYLGNTYESSTTLTAIDDTVTCSISKSSASVPADYDGANPVLTTATSTATISVGSTIDTANWTYLWTIFSGVGSLSGATTSSVTVSTMTTDSITVRLTATKATYPTQTLDFVVTKAKAGPPGTSASNVVGDLSNQTQTVSTTFTGTGYVFPSPVGVFNVFNNITNVTTSSTFSISGSATKSGLTISINSTTGQYNLSGASWTSDSEYFDLQAVYGGVTVIKRFTISKSKTGVPGTYKFIFTSASVITKDGTDAGDSGGYTPSSVTATGKIFQSGVVSNYGYVSYSINGGIQSAKLASITYTPAIGDSYITVFMYDTDTTTLLDQEDIAIVFKGRTGGDGTIGSLTGYGATYGIQSTSWSDSIANRVIYNMLTGESLTTALLSTTHLSMGDTVTLSDGTVVVQGTFARTKTWSGTAWLELASTIDGNLLVKGTVSASAVTAGTIDVLNGKGELTLGKPSFVGGNLYTSFLAKKKVSDPQSVLISAVNTLDTAVTIWGATSDPNGNAVSGTWHASAADLTTNGTWSAIGILGAKAYGAAVVGATYSDTTSMSGGKFVYNTGTLAVPVGVHIAELASSTYAASFQGSVDLIGNSSTIKLKGVTGTAGQVLTSAGPGLTPTWTVPSTTLSYAGLQAVTSGTTGSALDLTATMRIKGLTQPGADTGSGLELGYAAGLAWIQSYNRTTPGSFTSMNINASSVAFNCAVTGTSFAGITGLAGTGSATTAAKSDHTHSYGTVTSFSFTNGNGITGTVANSTTTPALSFTLGAVTGTSFNGITGFTATLPAALGTANAGSATTAARSDHVHAASTISYAGLQAVTSGTTGSALDLTATMRIKGLTQPGAGTGPGLELAYAANLAWIQSYNRTTSTFTPMNINASSVAFNCAVTGTSFAGITGLAGTGSATTAAKSDHTHSYGTVTSFSFTNGNGITGTVANSTTTPALSFTLGAVTGTSFNGITGFTATLPAALGTANAGSATTAARSNHVHAAPTSINGNRCYGGAASSGASGSTVISFGVTFSNTTTMGVSAIATAGYICSVDAISTTGMTVTVKTYNTGVGTSGIGVRWVVVGPLA